ncbi:sigma-54 factor interaction domain-containing protein [Desulfococcaceae bacterium HSG7]|nr:sigma-54 factor interaction domain-containing protein [Desulfococcaceae bacterium HSG7]
MKIILARSLYIYELERANRKLTRQHTDQKNYHGMHASSAQMLKLFKRIRQVSETEYPVLIRGETGTGKERVACAVKASSCRADNPMVILNCTAIPESLLESELFGHQKGAFTGAVSQKRGKLELAHKGTLFLDEIGDMPLALQAKFCVSSRREPSSGWEAPNRCVWMCA